MDTFLLAELEQRLNTLPDEEEMMFMNEKDIYEDFLSANTRHRYERQQ